MAKFDGVKRLLLQKFMDAVDGDYVWQALVMAGMYPGGW